MNPIVFAIVVVVVLGLAGGVILVLASKFMAVYEDPRIAQVTECLAGANCGGCGYAKAIVENGAPTFKCAPGGDKTADAINTIMGNATDDRPSLRATVICAGGENCGKRFDYQGIQTCAAAASIAGGPSACAYGCLGLGDCTRACKFDAIHVINGVAVVDRKKCTGCRKCVEHCRFNALVLVKGAPMLFDEVCHSCGVCAYVCPEGAVSETEREVGAVETGMSGEIKVATGELKLGEATGVPVIAAALAEAGPEDGLTIIDCPPGSACPVMESAREADYCVLVTEPTAFGLHDLRLVVELMRVLKKPCGVVINKAGAEYPELERYLEAEGLPVLARIPYSEKLAAAGARGALAYREDGEARSIFDALLSRIRKEARA